MENLIIIGILVMLVGTAVFYIRKEKKKGTRCIGCPSAGCCSGRGCANMDENAERNCIAPFERKRMQNHKTTENIVGYGKSFGRDWSN